MMRVFALRICVSSSLERVRHLGDRDGQGDRFTRSDVREVEQVDLELRVPLLDFAVLGSDAASFIRLHAIDFHAGDGAMLLDLVAHFQRQFRRDLEMQHRTELPGRLLLEFGLGDSALHFLNRGDDVLKRLLDVFRLDARLHPLGLQNVDGLAKFLFGELNRERAESDLAVVIADFAFHLLDFGSPNADFSFRLQKVLDLAFAVLDDLEQPFLHGASGTESAFDVGVFLGNFPARDGLILQFAELDEIAAQTQHEIVEHLRRRLDDDAARHFAVGELIAGGGVDERPARFGDGLGDDGDGDIEGVDFEINLADANDELALRGLRLGSLCLHERGRLLFGRRCFGGTRRRRFRLRFGELLFQIHGGISGEIETGAASLSQDFFAGGTGAAVENPVRKIEAAIF